MYQSSYRNLCHPVTQEANNSLMHNKALPFFISICAPLLLANYCRCMRHHGEKGERYTVHVHVHTCTYNDYTTNRPGLPSCSRATLKHMGRPWHDSSLQPHDVMSLRPILSYNVTIYHVHHEGQLCRVY